MIVSAGGKSYDTADGSEQPHARSAAVHPERGEGDADRWADDGAPPRPLTATRVRDAHRKPIWSVLSLRRLGELLRLVRRGPRREEDLAAESEHKRVKQADERKHAAQKAFDDFYRNAWENT